MGYLFVGLGGAFGAISRVILTRLLPAFVLNIPIAIMCVNILGCFAIGLLTEIFALHGNAPFNIRHFLIQGFLGGFTTFSSFSLEFGVLYTKGLYILAFIYAAFFGGIKLIKITF